MKTLSIRQASESLGRAPATIRRYIKSGRLPAEKEPGKFGEEFRIKTEDLQALGLVREDDPQPRPSPESAALPVRWAPSEGGERLAARREDHGSEVKVLLWYFQGETVEWLRNDWDRA